MTVVLPYDGSAVARAALRRLAAPAYGHWTRGRLLLLLPPASRCSAHRVRADAHHTAGPAVTLRFRHAAASPARLSAQVADLAAPTLVAPVPTAGASTWYRAVAAAFLGGAYRRSVAIYLDAQDVAAAAHRRPAATGRRALPRQRPLRRRSSPRCHHLTPISSGIPEVEP